MLYLALIPGNYVGWGICSRYLIQEVSRLTETEVIDPSKIEEYRKKTSGSEIFHTIGDHNLTRAMDITGKVNYGYTFFENLIPDHAKKNAEFFDLVFAGSTWCREKLMEKGITWSRSLIQGIDPGLFYPVTGEKPGAKDFFVIFSGGKLELRKGQDIVIRAVKVMQDRHKDILFVNCWHNAWAFSMNTLAHSSLISFQPHEKCSTEFIGKMLLDNGIDLNRTEILPLIPQDQLRKIYEVTDVGLFPNRCEGGTNLVLMEYMACGKPVVASYNTGHKDILTDRNSLLLEKMSPIEVSDDSGNIDASWEDPDLDEVIENLEYAYQNRDSIKKLGRQAGEDLKKFTWKDTAVDLVNKIEEWRHGNI